MGGGAPPARPAKRIEPSGAPPLGLAGTGGFEFVIDDRRPQVSDEAMLTALRDFAAVAPARADGRAFGREDFNAWEGKPCGAQAIMHRFGTWRRALERAGIMGGRACEYSAEELVEHLRAVWRKRGRVPHVHTFREYGLISVGPYCRRWGTLRKACEALAKFERGEIPWEELLAGAGRRKRRAIRPRTRWEVFERDGHRCVSCGRGAGEVKLEVDHIVPVCKGGTDELSNLRTLCLECNRGRGGRGGGTVGTGSGGRC